MLTSKLEAAQARIREQWYPHFSWLINEDTPWTATSRPLNESTVALISTCGLYCLDTQLPFAAWNDAGDPSFREIHIDTPVEQLRISHSHYDHQQVAADVNVALPVVHFRQLVEERAIARLYPWAYSFMGYLPEAFQLIHKTAPQVARRLAGDGVHAAFLTPCWPICQQSVGLIARAIEAEGVPTVCVVMNRNIAENVGIPRALHVRFPYGAPLGPAGHGDTQREVIREALGLFGTATKPGVVVESTVEWPE